MSKASTLKAAAAAAAVATAAATSITAAEGPATTTYLVLSVPIRHNDQVFQPGADIELTEAEAERLAGLVVAKNPPEEPANTSAPGAAGDDGTDGTTAAG